MEKPLFQPVYSVVVLTLLFMVFSSSCLFLSVFAIDPSGLSTSRTDGEALILFKKMIQKDPNGVLSSWELNNDPCTWNGVSCSLGRITELDLSNSNLVGTVSFHPLASLDSLSVLNLLMNSFNVNSSSSLLQLPLGLKHLDLSFTKMSGLIPNSFFSRYSNLVYINLSYNNITGVLPQSVLGNADYLQVLDLSYNNLTGSISGIKLVKSCTGLSYFDLSGNHFTGSLPWSLSNCTNLTDINLSNNLFNDEIPRSFGTFSRLQRLDMSHNHLTGSIPSELGSGCQSLIQLVLSNNNISGPIPVSLSSCSWLQVLDLANNNISGPFPDSIIQNHSSLDSLLLSNNMISGSIPSSISSCKKLRIVDFSSNKISGHIPPDICSNGALLEELRMPDNLIKGEIPPGLSQCSELKTIDLSINYLSGPIPKELGRLANLERLMAWYNSLSGPIPEELGQCRGLKNLILNNNLLQGRIPIKLFTCINLEWVSLTSNRITGEIPPEFGLLPRLAVLQLANNSLTGQIPKELANCSSLIPPRLGRQLGAKTFTGILSGNTLAFVRNVGNSCKGVGGLLEFSGIRPQRLLEVPSLKTCDFTRMYSGAVLSVWAHYQTLEYLDLSYNELDGKIPDEVGDIVALQVLDLAHNKLSGEIPASFGHLRNLGVFDASYNKLQGQIPESFSNLSFLVQIDLSNNALTGPIPSRGQLSTLPASQYANNPGLCGVPLPPCTNDIPQTTPPVENGKGRHRPAAASWANSIVLGVLISVASVCILIVWAIAMRAKRREAQELKMLSRLHANHAATTWKIDKEKEPLSINVATFQMQLRKLKFSQLIEATNGFAAASLIGSGGFGEVFKATMKDGSSVAIKKLIRLSCQGDREFMAEMETLGKIKHKNLVPLMGYCKIGEERLLVYEFMQFGSLEDMLHGKMKTREGRILTWEERKKIARGAAKGLCFLHHNCIPHIIHRDMKSSNVLLDHEMEARVSDFGMARLISALDTHLSVSTLAGTPGYVPPEYYQSFRCTAKGDVYSFGVVMLELLTGKRPTDKDDFGDTNLVGWVKMKVREGKGKEVIDPALLSKSNENDVSEVKEITRYMEITLQCVDDFPSRRPNMLQVVAMLRDLLPVDGASASNSA
ncbi:hypothetical protein AQUCO_00201233v1 [Aquilegia coerulea]|uniref:non-specific serine/threonine protein kinase n=1 Tax=Aquilegia coerulea TaxID=218851 RepID=A0A2G5F769_AQUCA|nr:hypothetical protein AQUCO_00201233v1 [Aquilegia coerulea]